MLNILSDCIKELQNFCKDDEFHELSSELQLQSQVTDNLSANR